MDLQAYMDEFMAKDWPQADEGTVRFAMVGLGWWTMEFAIPATEVLDHLETTVVVSSTTEKAEGVAEDHETIEHGLTYEEFQNGEATDAYDAVYIATPNALHLPYVESAAEFGKDILCEKPLEANTERAEKLVEAAEGVTLGVEYRMHVQPAVRMMRELVDSGFIGDVAMVHGNMSQPLLEINDNYDQWRLNPDMAGPGASVTDLGIYSINTTRFVIDADPVAVTATDWSGHEAFDEVPDERAAFTVEFPDGVVAACTASQNTQETSNLRIIGTEGELLLEDAFLSGDRELTITRGETTITTEFDGIEETRRSLGYFGDHILTDTDILGDGEHGLVDQRAIDAVYEAAETGERTEL